MINEEILYYSKGDRVISGGVAGRVASTEKSEGTNIWLLCINFDDGTTNCVKQTVVQKVIVAGGECSQIGSSNTPPS